MFLFLYTVYFQLWVICESDLHISVAMEKLTEMKTFRVRKTRVTSTFLFSCYGFMGTVVNQALPSFHEELLEITLSVLLIGFPIEIMCIKNVQ